ncbi:sigma-54-dependent Fis family transcriptional regulator [Rhodobacter sp. SGA-6-6]|uniref:helix-turn-helix domain-containing protein n=1 Tax=Rhodobacter sp. SGA-6-6 TaxID=2710882 RepID=UPI0013EA6915|nr:helix-turn-helix domain-containing protein [Rhodobacter sp. SGA-6-6]NGM45830.1 sigma-54-dependent Fis family transcriptional regulator [Rhodobacter sp. SGA-6-6]
MPTSTTQHSSRIEAAISGGLAARSALAASWARSARLYRLDPAERQRDHRITAQELAQARDSLGALLPAAAPHLDRLFQAVGGLGACIVLADAQGIAVDRRGNPGDDADFSAAGLWTGTAWSEAEAGTNGIGTCLAEGRAVTIHREQHFLARNIGLSCSSAPVHGPEGQLMAVIDVSTARADLPDAVAGLIGATVAEVARKVEADLFHRHFPRARMVLVPGLDRGLGALLAVDADDLVIGATRAARSHLGLTGDLAAAPRPVADLLGLESHDSLAEAERAVLSRALARSGGNVSAAARALGLSRATLHRKLDRT